MSAPKLPMFAVVLPFGMRAAEPLETLCLWAGQGPMITLTPEVVKSPRHIPFESALYVMDIVCDRPRLGALRPDLSIRDWIEAFSGYKGFRDLANRLAPVPAQVETPEQAGEMLGEMATAWQKLHTM